MAKQLTPAELAKKKKWDDPELYAMYLNEKDECIIPACCSAGCETEPDGECEHGFPSILMAMGYY